MKRGDPSNLIQVILAEGMGDAQRGTSLSTGKGGFFSVAMKLRVNGVEYETGRGTLSGLLEELKVTPERVAVEVNLKVVRKADYGSLRLNEGDVVEIVNFVGGGEADLGSGDEEGRWEIL
jgi:thiamine biosynthesis protein ThiS